MNNAQNHESSVAGVAGDGPSFAVSDFDRTLIRSIVARAFRDKDLARALDFADEGEADARQTLTMDLTACHANGCPINLVRLLDANDVDFGHDITGIQRHIDRRTGKLRRAFGPRMMMTDAERQARADREASAQRQMDDLLAAAKQAGRAEFAIEVDKRNAIARKAAEDKRRKARNARRRKNRTAVNPGKSAAPANRRRPRR